MKKQYMIPSVEAQPLVSFNAVMITSITKDDLSEPAPKRRTKVF